MAWMLAVYKAQNGSVPTFVHARTNSSHLQTLYDAIMYGTWGTAKNEPTRELQKQLQNPLIIEDVEYLSASDEACLEAILDIQATWNSMTDKPAGTLPRIICTTTADLEELCKQGIFPSGLYCRISPAMIKLPDLSERMDDLEDICQHMLLEIGKRYQLNQDGPHLSYDALALLRKQTWRNNLRGLSGALEHAFFNCKEPGVIRASDIDLDICEIGGVLSIAKNGAITKNKNQLADAKTPHAAEEGVSLEDYFQNFLLQHQDSLSETELAQKLGISRKCLWERRQRFGIPRKTGASGQGR
jgi:DNA-binding NtrC family response regulator